MKERTKKETDCSDMGFNHNLEEIHLTGPGWAQDKWLYHILTVRNGANSDLVFYQLTI